MSPSLQCDLGSTVKMKRKSFRGKEPHRAVLWMKKRVQASEEGPLPGPTAKQVRLGGEHGSPTTGLLRLPLCCRSQESLSSSKIGQALYLNPGKVQVRPTAGKVKLKY